MVDEFINRNIPEILRKYKKIAVVGISNKLDRDSYLVAKFMKSKGCHIFPVNPSYEEVLGIKCYSSLLDIYDEIELVDIFRRSEFVLPIVEQAIKIKAKVVWMQLGVIHQDAAKVAFDAGLKVVMNRCWKQEYQYNISD